jgi:hypothetical protein
MRVPLLLCLLYWGCNTSDTTNVKAGEMPVMTDSIIKDAVRPAAKSIEKLVNYTWEAHHPDTTNFLCEMKFVDEYAMIFFHGQCIYFFFTYTTHAQDYQQVQLEWTYKKDCLLDMSFFEDANGVRNFPKLGDHFATYRLVNDSTLGVEYKFPEWVQKVNQIAQDSLFPQRLFLKNPHGS